MRRTRSSPFSPTRFRLALLTAALLGLIQAAVMAASPAVAQPDFLGRPAASGPTLENTPLQLRPELR